MKPLTDDEATKVLLAERNYYREPELIWLALTHALAAIEDRAALVKIADRGWPGGAELDAARRHMRGKK